MKRIMILGAGPFQVAAIRTAVELGYHTITADNVPDNIGHAYSHGSVNISTTDTEALLKAASELQIDGIFTMASDVALPSLAYVSKTLGFDGPSLDAVLTLSNKIKFRAFQKNIGLEFPNIATDSSEGNAQARMLGLGERVVVKPSCASGSRGVTLVFSSDGVRLEAALAEARKYSWDGEAFVEEFVDGYDTSVDGIFINGEPCFAHFTQKYQQGFAVTGHRLPGDLNRDQKQTSLQAIRKIFRALGYMNGPFDVDLRVNKDRVVVIEAAPRLGGNAMPLLSKTYSGIDLIGIGLRLAMRDEYSIPTPQRGMSKGCGSTLIASDHSGRLESAVTGDEIRAKFPEILKFEFSGREGDEVSAFRHGGDVFGYVVFGCESDEEYQETAGRIRGGLNMRLRGRDA